MSFEMLVSFFLITVVATLTPGPTMLYIASCGLSQGTKGYLSAGLGVLIADIIYFIIAVTGLSAILLASHELFSILKWLGAAYLIYLGCKLIFSSNSISLDGDPVNNNVPLKVHMIRNAFINGFFIHLANPKTILFFSALLPHFINTDKPMLIQFVVIGAILISTQAVASIIYGSMGNVIRAYAVKSQSSRKLGIVSGCILIIAGLWLATTRKSQIA